ncbi:bifunctional ADP-dependent NAD(P)H-hydrate dehydratase/NAD(P)H-hydrate epimerase [Corynebacterium diphtheriae]|uniref:bifunctional ADP-dependent NAD(P)H-hydrate dehydratase/NAD(P)H-hydrate epimerase n=1 Tax=Corynebacterium diphtheriae TaxID=1717 RepID=UPI0013C87275|nr:bifunctional ADP-dependent NAD(P)H-hydrate dehydratase/NAD(P)H-hydrate epimerase [Corynebacterium diphtheriae]MBG9253018.1 bifunctional ADP-dependent NAD(P)H-hydrate dehydratase/NAD(P)H-hydrate epimerase [Corynebacterium diphtheriae bv. mitis]CAB0715724.1 bifunctional ADP-dependent NAD(P)H-hydrate dehydratase/NAD(P)H-hydrate epimerase [Corynebacterium diphtheriae]CAB0779469.1 bifunctional ADP-dependent NAD(P)H-hydrate dehydratase/NAD(P)H-hydrate epimerase [Corynebacterium diphtheriae]CAB0779
MFAYSTEAIRLSENPMIAAAQPDALMKQAAQAVAEAAVCMVPSASAAITVVAGTGGNGGDGLYAGAILAQLGYRVHAVLTGESAHAPALSAFVQAGGCVDKRAPRADLVIDAILGLGGTLGLRDAAWQIWQAATAGDPLILAVDAPSGIAADTGTAGEQHVVADATITFGAARIAHAVSAECGEVLIADINVPEVGGSLAAAIASHTPELQLYHAIERERYPWPEHFRRPEQLLIHESLEPGAFHNKYSGGVVGVVAGSAHYPGAAVLTATAAVRATSSMVRYAGPCAREVVRACPEVVATDTLIDAGRVQAWAYGPGAGDTDALGDLLEREEPLVIDADGITQLAQEPALRELMHARNKSGRSTLLTPHEGEFWRLASCYGDAIPADDRVAAVRYLAHETGCAILLKGRITTICVGDTVTCVDARNSWAATPGSGDVLTGILGAWIARNGLDSIALCVAVHATAAWLSAHTEYGLAPTSALRIANTIPQATALLSQDVKLR